MLLHYSMHKIFTSHFKSSQDDCSQLAAHNSRTSRGCLPTRTPCKRASVSPINPWSDTRGMLFHTVLQLLRRCWNAWRHCWRGHVTPLHSCFIQVIIVVAWQQTRRGDARLVTARREHRFVYCCVIAGTCFEVTVLVCISTPQYIIPSQYILFHLLPRREISLKVFIGMSPIYPAQYPVMFERSVQVCV
jgi:hypothetical protein